MISFLLRVNQPLRILMVVLYVGSIAALSLLPPQDLPKVHQFRGFDKMVHFMMYFIFSGLLCWAIRLESNAFRLIFVVLFTMGWGVMMEYLQLKMHIGRSFSYYDILANCLGVIFGIAVYIILSMKFKPNYQT